MNLKYRELLTSVILYISPWLGSLLGGWCLAETFLPPHRYQAVAAALTLVWAFLFYPLYCRISAQQGLDAVHSVALFAGPGVLGVIISSVLLFGWMPLLSDVLAVLHPVLQLALYPVLGCLVWFAPVAVFFTRRIPPGKD